MSGSQLLLLGNSQVTDPYYEYTTLLLPGNGTNGAQNNTFLDSSTNNFTITRNGNTTQGTFSPFSQTGWSNYFDGSGDYLTAPDNAASEIGASDFCIEGWLYPTVSNASYQTVFCKNQSGISGGYGPIYITVLSNVIRAYSASGSTSWNVLSNATFGTLQLNSWNHFVICRSGANWGLYLNGTRNNTASSTATLLNNTANYGIGAQPNGSEPTNGYISNVRLVIGSSVYDPTQTTLTIPTAPLTAITNTQLLTCQSNRFIDNSTNAFAITRNGDVSVQAFSPFNPTAAWNAVTNGGSGYFDGSGDFLNFTDSSNVLDLGGAVASLEMWVYFLNVTTLKVIFTKGGGANSYSTSNGIEYNLLVESGFLKFAYNIGGSGTNISGTVVAGQWTHVAIATDASNNIAMFINGVKASSSVNAISKPTTRTAIRIAESFATAEAINAYISGVRFITGTGAYNPAASSFSIPTEPPTAVTNTSLLCNFTNAGIYDATSKNDLETVGNAQISTTQSKFGGSSMYFDGTGDYLVAPSNFDLQMGTGDFTIEAWIYVTAAPSVGARARIYSFQNHLASQVVLALAIFNSAGTVYGDALLRSADGTNLADYAGITAIPLNTWTHIAFARSGTTGRLFVNGIVQDTGGSQTQNLSQNLAAFVGAAGTATEFFTGYIQGLRVTKGYARYTAAFTPPTAAFPLL